MGTGTEYQYNQLLDVKCDKYVLALDPDDAGRHGIKKLATFLNKYGKSDINVALLPDGRDINDLSEEEFHFLEVVPYYEWCRIYKDIE